MSVYVALCVLDQAAAFAVLGGLGALAIFVLLRAADRLSEGGTFK